MFQMKYAFIVCLVLVLASALMNTIPRGARFDVSSAVSIAIAASALGSTAIIFLERKRIGYTQFVKNVPAESDSELLRLLCIDKVIPGSDYILVQSNDRLLGHAYAKITDVPYLIDDLDRERKIWYVGNFARILSTISFTFEIIPRIMPVSTDAYMKNINKQIEDLRLTISSEGSAVNPGREARLKHLEKLSARLLTGEGVRDVGFLAHVMVEAKNEEEIIKQLDSNMKTMTSALESGLGVRTERLTGHKMMEAVQEFFRASPVIQPSRMCRLMSWDLAYLIPFTRPKMPSAEKLIGGVYMGRTSTGAMVCLDTKRYANPHIAVLGKSGFGKSTTVKTFISRFYDLSATPTIIIDYAGEYLDWVRSRNGTIIDMRKDRINPFELGQTTLIDRTRQVIDSFDKTCEFNTVNQRNAFAEYVAKAYTLKGYKLDDAETWKSKPPAIQDLIELMKKDMKNIPALKQITVQSLIHRLEALSSGPFGIYGQSTISINSLTQGLVCIDLSKVSSSTLKDLIAWTVLQYLDTMMRLEGLSDDIRLLIVLDEAWKLCKDEKSLPVALIKEGRKFGYSLTISTQDIIDVAEPILSNAGTVIIHRTEHPRYLNFFKRAYDLTELEISKIKNLEIGEALIKLSTDPKPFIAKIDMENVRASERGKEIQRSGKTISSVKSEELPISSEKQENILPHHSTDLHDLSGVEERLFKVVAEESPYSIVECYQKVGVNEYQGNKAKQQLLKKEIIEQVTLPTLSRKGRKPVALALTEKGRIEAEKLGLKIPTIAGRKGGLIHRYLIDLIAREFQKRGIKTDIEYPIGEGKTVDLVVGSKVAVEVETGYSDIKANTEKLVQSRFERIVIVCISCSLKQRLEKEIILDPTKRTTIVDINELPRIFEFSG